MASTKRNTRLKALVKGPNGRNLCRWCATECAAARRTFCGPECVHQYLIRAQPQYVRQCLFDRDLGTCELCGHQCGSPRDRYRRLCRLFDAAQQAGDHDIAAKLRESSKRLYDQHAMTTSYRTGDPWDADHIVPVVEGGGECGLDNYRTLCRPCHKRVTAELAKRRAAARKLVKKAPSR